MNEHDVALIKSLVAIIGRGTAIKWVYHDESDADVVIVDMDERANMKVTHKRKPRALVAYASPDRTLIPNTYALTKPARARELMQLLDSIRLRWDSEAAPV
jgi:uncharacterized Rossmann fold enzyme